MGAMENNSTASYVGWEEVIVSSEKGRREVNYYLKRAGGAADLVVVGKEKSVRHMSYYYAIRDKKFLFSSLKLSSLLKLRSRKEVVDWLDSIITVSGEQPDGSFGQFGCDIDRKLENDIKKDGQIQKLGHYRSGFMWLGSPWTCRKRRRHYQSFCRNGVVISVQDFVYVLAEENKRLVAYLDDMYEDARCNKMVVVRWFHKIDEVGFVLPHNYNNKEIFFSLCVQDLNVECIDGRATVLSPEHYAKFTKQTESMVPFVCHQLYDNDEIKPFDITSMKGYWKQEILRKKPYSPSSLLEPFDDDEYNRPTKKIKEREVDTKPTIKREPVENTILPTCGQYLTVGSEVEVLSQDSGIRGCWFRALIIKKHKEKVKVRYQDLTDVFDETKHLEEWILASRLAEPDVLGIRISGRTIVRATRLPNKDIVSCSVNVGSIVDAWWHDGWWEGIIMSKESEDKLRVYFPGEKKEFIFNLGDLRHSQEWFEDKWQHLMERPEIVLKLYRLDNFSSFNQDAPFAKNYDSQTNQNSKIPSKSNVVMNLLKDDLLAKLRWKSSGKRRLDRKPVFNLYYAANDSTNYSRLHHFDKFIVNSSLKFDPDSSLKFDPDDCKYGRDSHLVHRLCLV